MSLFQKSVEKKYLNELDSALIDKKYKDFQDYFGNKERQEEIRDTKEEQFQEGFLRELFVGILGYTLKPEPNYNLTTEFKNVDDSKKADGAILKGENAIAVIELKGTDTTDLDKIETQAFGYKNHHPKCIYVITSNFEKLRFYIQNAIDPIKFDLFNLTRDKFALLWLCLSKDNLISDLPLKIKDSSVLQEEKVTEKLYADYSQFRKELFENIKKENPAKDKLLVFKKTQKLLDRFLFIFFAEDRQLLPPNSISEIITQWEKQTDWGDEIQLYDRYKKYFHLLNTGWKGKKYEIFAYNGGLFAPDETLDSLIVNDDILKKHTLKLSGYNFNPETTDQKDEEKVVDVNILGHIFEHSLGEIENVQAEIKGEKLDQQKTRRKKEGIFYTPKYITKYIVENTVGKLCEEKRDELEIINEDYAKGRKNRKKDIVKSLDEKLTIYRDWLLSLTILDPACGSGAFLNQALEFLIEEHHKIDDLRAQLFGGGIVFSDITSDILEKNIFGVDLNEESVDIAKLSLWLRTAQKGRKLNTLSNNIKCGNSLIDDPEVAGEKAFNWQNEFPEIFKNGGFDVVIGNPPYVRNEFILSNHKSFLENKYKVFTGKSDLYVYFFELAHTLLKSNGLFGVIVSSKYTKTKYGKVLINFLQNETKIESFIDFQDLDVFSGIVAYPSIILLRKQKIEISDSISNLLVVSNENYQEVDNNFMNSKQVNQMDLFARLGSWTNGSVGDDLFNLIHKIEKTNSVLSQIIEKPQVGIKTGANACYIFPKTDIPNSLKKSVLLQNYLIGREVKRFQPTISSNKILCPYLSTSDSRLELISNTNNYKQEFDFLEEKKNILSQRAIIDKGLINNSKKWYEFQQIKLDFPFKTKYIVYPDISSTVNFTFADDVLIDMTCFGIPSNSKSLLGILNSSLMKAYLNTICVKARGGYLRLKSQYILNIPIPTNYENDSLNITVEKMLELNHSIFNIESDFVNLIVSKSNDNKVSRILQNWIELTPGELLTELKKNKIVQNLSEEADWLKYFNEQKEKAQEIKSEINKTDKEIDQMVYELYGLSEEEIKIVEESV
ncbi:MAG: N-6 DNA methylase [Bacteroidales bacterium]|nr:N-6 DNA methylase [Bacteroidales bacterium]